MRPFLSACLLPVLLASLSQPVFAISPDLAAFRLAQAQPNQAGQAQLKKMRDRLNSFDLLGAEQVLAAVSEREPVDKALLRSLVYALVHHEFPNEGSDAMNWGDYHRLKLKWLHHLIDEKISQTSDEYLALAGLYALDRDWHETQAFCEHGLKLNPPSEQRFSLYLQQTQALLGLNRPGLAAQNLEHMSKLVPQIYVSASVVQARFDDEYRDVMIVNMDEEAEDYTKDAHFLKAQMNLRWLMTKQALKLAPNFAPAHSEYSFLLFIDDQYPLALKHISEAIRLEPGNYEYVSSRGNIHWLMGNAASARKDFTQAIQMLTTTQKTRPLNSIEKLNLEFLIENRDGLK